MGGMKMRNITKVISILFCIAFSILSCESKYSGKAETTSTASFSLETSENDELNETDFEADHDSSKTKEEKPEIELSEEEGDHAATGDNEGNSPVINGVLKIDDRGYAEYEEFANAVLLDKKISDPDFYYGDYEDFSLKDAYYDCFVPIEAVFPEYSSDGSLLKDVVFYPDHGQYAYRIYRTEGDVRKQITEFRKYDLKDSLYLHQNVFDGFETFEKCDEYSFETLNEKKRIYVEGRSGSLPYICRYQYIEAGRYVPEAYVYETLFIICKDAMYTVKKDFGTDTVFTKEYIDALAEYIMNNIAPKNGGLKEYDPEKSFLEIYKEAIAK